MKQILTYVKAATVFWFPGRYFLVTGTLQEGLFGCPMGSLESFFDVNVTVC